MKTVSLKLTAPLAGQLAAVAKRRGVTKSAVVREALERYLTNGRRSTPPTVHELIADLIGSVKGGPADLATNAAHLEGFGR
jgi:hypothetical protein